MEFEDTQGLTPFPFIAEKTDTADYKLIDPINEMLEQSIKVQMPELMTMGMIYEESSKLFPFFAVKPTYELNFDQESGELRKWIDQTPENIPPEIKSLYFTHGEDELHADDYLETYSISLLGADTYDEDFNWIYDAQSLAEKNFQSKTLDNFFQFKDTLFSLDKTKENANSLDIFLGRIAFLEDILLYGYCSLLIIKALRSIKDKAFYRRRNVFYGIRVDNEFISHRSLDLTSLMKG